MSNQPKEPQSISSVVKCHSGATRDFSVDGFGWVMAWDRKTGGTLKSQSVEALLLLEIIQSLESIRMYGTAQDLEYGQRMQKT